MRERGDALVIKAEQSKYTDVRSIRRTRKGEMILKFKRDKERKGKGAIKNWWKRSLAKGLRRGPLQATLKVKNLHEVTGHRRRSAKKGAGRD